MTFKLGIVILVHFALHAKVEINAEPIIRAVELNSFGGDISRISSLYNSTWYVVGKCCPIGQVFVENHDELSNSTATQCRDPLPDEKVEFSPIFSPFNESGMLWPGEEHPQFTAVMGIPCQNGMYVLEPEISSVDEYHLLANGSIYSQFLPPVMKAPGRDYCMEYVPGRNIAVMVCFEKELKIVTADTRLAFYAVGLLTSVPFLLATVLAYSITFQLRDIYGLALCCYSGSLAVAFFSLAVIQLGGHLLNRSGCDSAAYVIEFSFIACFFWLDVMIIEVWQLIKFYGIVRSAITDGRPNSNRTFFYYSLWAWGIPAVLIIVSLAKNLSPIIPWTYVKRSGNDPPSCWVELDKATLPYFYAPAGILVFINVIFFTLAGIKVAQIQRDLDLRRMARNEPSDREDRRVYRNLRLTFFMTLVLFLIMAINWSMELITILSESNLLAWSIFDFVNALQGVLVFGIFVLRKPARNLVWLRIKKLTNCQRSASNDSNDDLSNEMTLLQVTNNTHAPSSRILNQ